MMNPQKEYELGAEAFLTGDAAAGAEHLRHAAFAGHPEAQNQLARIYFSQLKQRSDLADLEAAAQGGDHVALFVLAMSFIDGKLVDKDTDKAMAALRLAAQQGNVMARAMLGD
ncbi:MAG: sel1 repeat family protein [Akkermansia sp.]|jgi:TPR repeat protein|nr:sel1 repeat family protein [Akkermansia sp.]